MRQRSILISLFLFLVAFGGISLLILSVFWGKSQEKVSGAQRGWKTIRPPHEVSALALQGEIIWAGGEDGVAAIDRSTLQLRSWVQCTPRLSYVQALLIDAQGVLWIGHLNGLSLWDGSGCKTLTETDGLPDRRVNALYRDRQGRIWIASWGGVTLTSKGEWQTFTSQHGLAHDMVNVLYQEEGGTFWFGSYVAPQGGLSICSLKDDKLRCQIFTTKSGLPHNNVTSILEERTGSIWVGTGLLDRGGAAKFIQNATSWKIHNILTKETGLAGMKVRSMYQDKAGALWFGSEYDGLACWEKNQWAYYGIEQGLSNPEVKVFLNDNLGNLWLGTADGITYIPHRSTSCLPKQSN